MFDGIFYLVLVVFVFGVRCLVEVIGVDVIYIVVDVKWKMM